MKGFALNKVNSLLQDVIVLFLSPPRLLLFDDNKLESSRRVEVVSLHATYGLLDDGSLKPKISFPAYFLPDGSTHLLQFLSDH